MMTQTSVFRDGGDDGDVRGDGFHSGMGKMSVGEWYQINDTKAAIR